MIQTLKTERPDVRITYVGLPHITSILQHHPDIYNITNSIPDEGFKVDLTDIAGRWENARGELRIESREEIYTLFAGLAWKHVKPKLYLTKDEAQWGREFLGNEDNPRIGVFLRSAEIWKDWRYTLDFINLCKEDGYEVWAIDNKIKADSVRNTADLTLRQLMSILIYMDCVISPDTAGHHLCESLDVPCIALFGSMPIYRYLSRGYECLVDYIQGQCQYKQPSCMYKICNGKGNYQPCMDCLKPEAIFQLLKEKINYGTIAKNRDILGYSL